MEVLLEDRSGNRVAGSASIRRRGPGTFTTAWSGGTARIFSPPPGPPPDGGPLFAIAAAAVLVGISAVLTAAWLARPLRVLSAAARNLGGGKLSTRTNLRRSDELGDVALAFDEMAGRIESLVRGQRELLANVSHELRSPLARIRVALELLPPDVASEARLRGVDADLADLDRLIEDILTTARLDEAGLPTRLDALDARQVLMEVAERARHDPLLEGTPVHVVDGLPVSLAADGALLRRAVWNLVQNAAKYGAPPITLSAERVGDQVALSVADDGPGIPAADRERVFMPFYRGDRARASGPARGLGLGL